MRNERSNAAWLTVSVLAFLLMSAAFTIMPLEVPYNSVVLSLLPGAMFWAGLMIGIVTQIVLSCRCRKWRADSRGGKQRASNKRIGLLSFLQTVPGCIADVTCIISAVALTLSLILTRSRGYFCYVFMALFVFSFCMHCVFNGKIYYQIKHQGKLSGNFEKAKLKEAKRRNEHD